MPCRDSLPLVVAALACVACSDTSGPPGASVRLDAPDRLIDTVGAVIGPLEATVYGDDGRPLPAATVYLHGRGGHLTDDPLSHNRIPVMSLISDADGRVGAHFVLGREAGAASVRAVFGALEDSVVFEVRPGALARLMPMPAETALAVGRQFAIASGAADRFGNARPDVLSPVVRSLRPGVAVVNGGAVATLAHGRATIELHADGVTDSAHVNVVPPGWLAVFDTVPIQAAPALFDIESGAFTPVTGIDHEDCPAWHPDGVRLLRRGLRLSSPGAATVDLLPADADLDARCGAFTNDGRWIFFEVVRSAGVSQIWRIRPDGSGLEQLTPDDDGIDAYSPSPSPDGTRFTYVLRYPNRIVNSHFIAVRDIAAGSIDTIAAAVDNYLAGVPRQSTVSWSPTGEWIAYTAPGHPFYFSVRSWRWGHYVHLIRPDGTGMRRIGETELAAANFYGDAMSWSPDGRWLAAKLHYPDLRLAVIDVATGDVLPLNGSTRAHMSPLWRP